MTKHAVTTAAELTEGGGKAVQVDGVRIALFLIGDAVRAFQDFCPHAGAPLSGGPIRGGVVTCPWHGWQFNLATGAHVDNPRCTLDAYRAEVVEGTVFVWV